MLQSSKQGGGKDFEIIMPYKYVKRLLDIITSFLGVIALIPITIIIKIAYILTGDLHSIFFIQPRIGKNGKTFKIIKYRSMTPHANRDLEKLLEKKEYQQQWKMFQKIDNDPRITKIGRFLRKSSIDEFPQFINVLLGHMSVVGPRPLVPGEIENHKGDAVKYQSVKPGVTGYWAMRVRSDKNSDYPERLKLEYFYIDNQSLALDGKIVFQTVGTVLKQEGAK